MHNAQETGSTNNAKVQEVINHARVVLDAFYNLHGFNENEKRLVIETLYEEFSNGNPKEGLSLVRPKSTISSEINTTDKISVDYATNSTETQLMKVLHTSPFSDLIDRGIPVIIGSNNAIFYSTDGKNTQNSGLTYTDSEISRFFTALKPIFRISPMLNDFQKKTAGYKISVDSGKATGKSPNFLIDIRNLEF